MVEQIKRILTAQFDAALCMLNQCAAACRPKDWEGKIANDTFRYVAYHTLFFADLYLTADENAFVLRDLHHLGGDERGHGLSPGLPKDQLLAYVPIVRQKTIEIIAAETPESLDGPSGFAYRKFSRAELHLYNIRHIHHHVGQLSAYLRRVDANLANPQALPWIGSGWK